MKCDWCDEEVTDADAENGARTVPVIEALDMENQTATARIVSLHRECFLRTLFGTVGHQKHTCHCYGGEGVGDPPGLTKRQAAIEAVALAYVTMTTDTGGVH